MMCSSAWFCHRQTAERDRQQRSRPMIRRVRSSSRWSTRLRRSSWPIVRIALAMALMNLPPRRFRHCRQAGAAGSCGARNQSIGHRAKAARPVVDDAQRGAMTSDDPDSQLPETRQSARPPPARAWTWPARSAAAGTDERLRADQLHVCFHCSGELVLPAGLVRGGPPPLAHRPALPGVRVPPRGRLRAGRRRTSRRRARPGRRRTAGRSQAHDAREHVRGNRVLRAGARRGPDRPVRFLAAEERLAHRRAGLSSCSAPRPRRRRGSAAPERPSGRIAGSVALASATTASACSRASSSAPVAAIRSHSSSACSGRSSERRSNAASSGSRSRARMKRQRDGAVEQVRAARLAGALDRARDVEHVVEHLKGEPDAAGERAERVRQDAAIHAPP